MANPVSACTICLEDMQPGASVCTLSCGHQFHKLCIDDLLDHSGKKICPLDRKEIQFRDNKFAEQLKKANAEFISFSGLSLGNSFGNGGQSSIIAGGWESQRNAQPAAASAFQWNLNLDDIFHN